MARIEIIFWMRCGTGPPIIGAVFTEFDLQCMRRALSLAERARGLTSPNPMVGAVVAQRGKIVGEGFHKRAGHLHAEALALKAVGKRARGATLYISLEP